MPRKNTFQRSAPLAANFLTSQRMYQEVDHYEAFVDPELRARGYEGVYKQRNGIDKQDGCATFWKRKSFRLVHSRAVELDGAIERARPYIETPSYITHNVAAKTVVREIDKIERQFGHMTSLLMGDFNSMPQTRASEPLYTNYRQHFKGTLDYIFFRCPAEEEEEEEEVLDVPSPQDLGSQGLPDKSQPSDHLPLVCRAKLREKTET
ncbi:hypothetical protein GUITHDRAFT_102251 [Guillardia theta CCMP2712]|uniref:Endonuclease/exonuclease/phosphatase domain-containing protein n=1 Tax=Guillardia theta (strain CCMP2712) TaxID=905079 RepID=L1JVL9_GUITC|nr:hypothetical protein GUITHDRAFT_102251 [Guillardia theta CCMP2712]EKX52349.1 hypothetical protein GUITHDRAFT_102251 [Guillardia theta CCMP2712]|eukprot:XP_005839329.1 hypothetical protein GUITHDRAFT_102251 [Guillardia theta CCMP2712]